jgi:glycyl-tRNA synthetase beta chain
VDRLKLLAGRIARDLGADPGLAERAAELCKADLLTGMVAEFPELQGVMGRYYALHDGESKEVADAIEAHYRPRVAGDRIPEGSIACAVALADKLDALAGLFSIRELPTGDKDPFGLRRAALGIVRIIVENQLSLSLPDLSNAAFEPFKSKSPGELVEFVYERFASYLKDLGFSTLQIDAVLSKNRTQPSLVPRQLEAVKAFQALPEAESLAAANKRVANILRQAEAKGEKVADARHGELKEPAERALHDAIRSTSEKAKALFDRGDYAGYLTTFSVLKSPVDAFFDSVMVMVDDPTLRRGRLALLRDLREAMNRVADISKLAVEK